MVGFLALSIVTDIIDEQTDITAGYNQATKKANNLLEQYDNAINQSNELIAKYDQFIYDIDKLIDKSCAFYKERNISNSACENRIHKNEDGMLFKK